MHFHTSQCELVIILLTYSVVHKTTWSSLLIELARWNIIWSEQRMLLYRRIIRKHNNWTFQLYLAAPFLLYVLHHRIRLGVILSILIISLSCLLRALYCTIYGACNNSDVDIPVSQIQINLREHRTSSRFQFISYPGIDPSTLTSIYEGLWEMYSRPHTKCGPFILGLLLGSLYSYWPNTRLSPRTTKLMSRGATVFAVGIIYAILPEYWYPGNHFRLFQRPLTVLQDSQAIETNPIKI